MQPYDTFQWSFSMAHKPAGHLTIINSPAPPVHIAPLYRFSDAQILTALAKEGGMRGEEDIKCIRSLLLKQDVTVFRHLAEADMVRGLARKDLIIRTCTNVNY